MNAKNRLGRAERFGRWLGRGWRAYRREERRAAHWLVVKGLSPRAAIGLQWVVKLLVLATLLYFTFWLTLLLVFAVAVIRSAASTVSDVAEPEWRDGMLGFGLYHPDGSRIDPHDPDEEA